ncbi:MAG: aminotransferase class IV [Chloroflexota bacterium]
METETASPYLSYLNGDIKSTDELTLSVKDIGVLRGYGVFDYLRTYNGEPFHLIDHIERLRHSAQQIGLELVHETEEIAEIVYDLLEKNGARSNEPLNVGIRLLGTGGVSPTSFTPSAGEGGLAVLIQPLGPTDPNRHATGIKLITTHLQREFPTVKSTNYIGAIMAMREAQKVGAAEALYVDQNGEISECTRSNIFFIKDGVLLTPENRILEGITRKVVLNLARETMQVEIKSIYVSDLAAMDEVFITSSTKEILAVTHIDQQAIGNGQVGTITQALHATFKKYAWGST